MAPPSDRSHAPRGNAALDAPRPLLRRDAERHRRRYHAERGNEHRPLPHFFSPVGG